jgi:hypothetical protein
MSAVREASCRCGQLTACCEGEPVRVTVCHCLKCQRRTGSAFGAQARFPLERVVVAGSWKLWEHTGESGNWARFRFCPECGATVAYENEGMPGLIAIPIGAFADPEFPAPGLSIWERRKHRWVAVLGDAVEHSA